jgi:putative glutathione S-transferase
VSAIHNSINLSSPGRDEQHNLLNYLRELYQTPGIADVCTLAGMKRGVFSKAGPAGSNGIVPIGPTVDYAKPHDRGRLLSRH